MKNEARKLQKDSGQGMTEYIIVVALVAIAAIGVTTMFGGNVRGVMAGATNALAGDTSVSVVTQKAGASETGRKTLATFGHQR